MALFTHGLARLVGLIRVRDDSASAHERPRPKPRAQRPKPWSAPEPEKKSRLFDIEMSVWGQVRETGRRILEEALSKTIAEVEAGASRMCPKCGKPMVHIDHRKRRLRSSFGVLVVWRLRLGCRDCTEWFYPADEALGIGSRQFTPVARYLYILFAMIATFAKASALAKKLFGFDVDSKTVWNDLQRCGRSIGEFTRRQDEAYNAPNCPVEQLNTQAPEEVELSADGCMVLTRRGEAAPEDAEESDPLDRPSRTLGREVKSAVIRPIIPAQGAGGERVRGRATHATVLGDADAFFARIWSTLLTEGLYSVKTLVVCVGDGGKWIWNRVSMFPHRVEILDFYHAAEHAWAMARLLWGEKSKTGRAWARRTVHEIKAGKVSDVISELEGMLAEKSDKLTAEVAKALTDLIGYYREHQSRMDYPRYLALGYRIGSGAVESAHKRIVHVRLRGAGMRWSAAGARNMLAVRHYYVLDIFGQAEPFLCAA